MCGGGGDWSPTLASLSAARWLAVSPPARAASFASPSATASRPFRVLSVAWRRACSRSRSSARSRAPSASARPLATSASAAARRALSWRSPAALVSRRWHDSCGAGRGEPQPESQFVRPDSCTMYRHMPIHHGANVQLHTHTNNNITRVGM